MAFSHFKYHDPIRIHDGVQEVGNSYSSAILYFPTNCLSNDNINAGVVDSCLDRL